VVERPVAARVGRIPRPAAPPLPSLRYRRDSRRRRALGPHPTADGLSVAAGPACARGESAEDEDENDCTHVDDPCGRVEPGLSREAPIACRLWSRSTQGSAAH